MYVRWKYRQTRAGRVARAILVECRWENGKPRQKPLAQLGSILECEATKRTRWNVFFDEVTQNLALFGETGSRDQILQRIKQRFPPPLENGALGSGH